MFLQGDLAMIFDGETNDFVFAVSGGQSAWLGAHRVGILIEPNPRNDQLTWIDGSAMEFSNWSSGQPDNYGEDEYCLEMWKGNGQWNDRLCDDNNRIDYYIR